jgi:hypothetical protein
MDRAPALHRRSKLMVLNDNSLRTICQKVKELNPKKIHLFKKILEKKLATKQTGNIIGDNHSRPENAILNFIHTQIDIL